MLQGVSQLGYDQVRVGTTCLTRSLLLLPVSTLLLRDVADLAQSNSAPLVNSQPHATCLRFWHCPCAPRAQPYPVAYRKSI